MTVALTASELSEQAVRPSAPFQTQSFRMTRPHITGPDAPVHPFPIYLDGEVMKGFGRGSKDLGCPTANLPDESIDTMASVASPGVYYGFAKVFQSTSTQYSLIGDECVVLPMVMSLGWNPYYKNERLTAEIHIIHKFESDFYGHQLKAIVLGYIRPELDYTSRGILFCAKFIPAQFPSPEALIEDIEFDKRVALKSLDRPGYSVFRKDAFFQS